MTTTVESGELITLPELSIRLAIGLDRIRRAVGQYVADVRTGQFPTAENSFHVPELEDLA